MWSIATPLLPEATKKKVRVARGEKAIRAVFEEVAPLSQVPRRYGGTLDVPFEAFRRDGPAEVRLREYVHRLNEEAGYRPPRRGADGKILGPWTTTTR